MFFITSRITSNKINISNFVLKTIGFVSNIFSSSLFKCDDGVKTFFPILEKRRNRPSLSLFNMIFDVFFYCFCFIKSILFTIICNEIAFDDSYIPIVSYLEYPNWLFADDQVFRCVMTFFFYFRTGSNRWRQRKVKTYYIIYSE